MPAGNPTLGNLLTINNENASGGVADELLEAAPLIRVMSAIPASNGDVHQYHRYTNPPPADFRAINTGRAVGFGLIIEETENCKILDASTLFDAAYADAYKGGRGAYLQMQNTMALRSAFARLERSVINGTAGSSFSDANGFRGFTDFTPNINASATNTESVCIDNGGTTNLTSVYVIRSADPLTTAAVVLGNDGNLNVGVTTEQATESSAGAFYNGLWTPIHSWYAYQHASKFSIVRIANVDSAATTPAIDDDKIGAAIAEFPTDRPATHIVYNRKVWKQHRASRTATNATGTEAPFPMDAYGLPIIVTDQLANDETQVT